MNTEEKSLLLKDLCARLPYGIKVDFKYGTKPLELRDISFDGSVWLGNDKFSEDIEDVKPYLRPMSSMTEKETEQFELISKELLSKAESEEIWNTVIDWLNEHYFDHRHLIEKGLALEAPEGMYDK